MCLFGAELYMDFLLVGILLDLCKTIYTPFVNFVQKQHTDRYLGRLYRSRNFYITTTAIQKLHINIVTAASRSNNNIVLFCGKSQVQL